MVLAQTPARAIAKQLSAKNTKKILVLEKSGKTLSLVHGIAKYRQ
jgi:hypothetical protein